MSYLYEKRAVTMFWSGNHDNMTIKEFREKYLKSPEPEVCPRCKKTAYDPISHICDGVPQPPEDSECQE